MAMRSPLENPPPPVGSTSRRLIIPGEGSTPLQQLQLIKGWVDAEGNMYNEVIPIAGTPNNGAGVDMATG